MKRNRILGLSTAAAAAAAATAAFLLRSHGIRKQEVVSEPRGTLDHRGPRAADLVGSASKHRRGVDPALLRRIEEALATALGAESPPLTVYAEDGGVIVRGEVATLDRISRASEVLAAFQDEIEVTNLIRLQVSAGGRTPAS
jgi:hypothetical protein